jgi:hypothetical protein
MLKFSTCDPILFVKYLIECNEYAFMFANTMEFQQEKVKGSQKDSKQVFEWSSYIDHQNPSPT